ncbi:hypothetical protein ACFLQ3_02540 [Bacteroidota bacterium]
MQPKKALEALADEEDEALGTLVNIVNTVTEKADTRNWQTLPYSISYARVPLENGLNNVDLKTVSPQLGATVHTFKFNGVNGKTLFHAYHTIASN